MELKLGGNNLKQLAGVQCLLGTLGYKTGHFDVMVLKICLHKDGFEKIYVTVTKSKEEN